MGRGLDSLNQMPPDEAKVALLRCCGSHTWAIHLIEKRPFRSVGGLHHAARQVWLDLAESDWLEAFAAHPKIGDRTAISRLDDPSSWATQEQADALIADTDTDALLEEANQAYLERFGFIYIVCATGKKTDEMLDDLRVRLKNEHDLERHVAADHQMRITEIRLNKLLSELGQHE